MLLYQLLYYSISDIYNKTKIFLAGLASIFHPTHTCPACTVYSFFDGFFHFSFLYPNSMRISLLNPTNFIFTYTILRLYVIYIYTSYIMWHIHWLEETLYRLILVLIHFATLNIYLFVTPYTDSYIYIYIFHQYKVFYYDCVTRYI